MDDVLVGILAVAVGLLVAFVGYRALRTMIALLGAFTGFGIGAAIGAGFPLDGATSVVVTWIVAFLTAVLFGWLAYAFYQVAVLLGLASIGFTIGSGLMLALGVGGWLVWGAGALVALVLVGIGLAGDLPAVLLIVLTGLAGANLAITGVMLLVGAVDLSYLQVGGADAVTVAWWWSVASLVLAVVGIASQVRWLRHSRAAAMHAQWARSAR